MEKIISNLYMDKTRNPKVSFIKMKYYDGEFYTIAKYDEENNKIVIVRKSKDLMEINNSFGINLELLNASNFKYDTIELHFENKILITERGTWQLYGKELTFNEPQSFLNLSKFNEKINGKNNE